MKHEHIPPGQKVLRNIGGVVQRGAALPRLPSVPGLEKSILGIISKLKGVIFLAKIKRETLRKRIEKDLKAQLEEKKITGNHYLDLVQDYLSFWDLKCALIDDIENYGTKIQGMHGPKTNPAINDLQKTNARMLSILNDLGLSASSFVPEADDEDDDM